MKHQYWEERYIKLNKGEGLKEGQKKGGQTLREDRFRVQTLMGQTDLAAEKKGRNKEEKVTEKQQRIEKRVNQERRRQIYILVFPDSNAFPCRSANIIKSRPQ